MNTLSIFGRMSYGAHMALTVFLVGGAGSFYSSYSKMSAEQAEKDLYENMPKAQKVDPDLFNPFTPMPFHNNIENKYRYADVKLHGYLNAKTQLNVNDYAYKSFHDCYDHSNKKQHYYNWISVVPSHDA